MRSVLVVLGVVSVLACGDGITGPDFPDVSVSVAAISSGQERLVRITFVNHDDIAALVSCGSFTLEKLTEDGWQPARGPNCIPSQQSLASGESRAVELSAPEDADQFRGAVRFRVAGAPESELWVAYSDPIML
ncbi:MAG TPA: hypothetical protein PLL69_11890 [Gemmatimonadales bacterium]|nr:hypothetical protein [Gemmatimonadales bacterium]